MSMKQNTSFWDGDLIQANPENKKDPLVLAQYKKAISNFVNIVTGRGDISVKFQGRDSYTDGKTITIGSNLTERTFDPVVGLALHEGSHILLTDFDRLWKRIEVLLHQEGVSRYKVNQIKTLINIIEDRRIDYHIFSTSPGYRDYYHAMYNKYFNAKIIDKALKLGEKSNSSDYEDYIFHICNFTNPNRNLDSLPGLRKIWEMIDIANINRLKNIDEVVDLAIEVDNVIQTYVDQAINEVSQSESSDGDSQSESSDGESQSADGDSQAGDDESQASDGGSQTSGGDSQLSPSQQQLLDRAVQKQKDFLFGDTKKTRASRKLINEIETISAADVREVETGSVSGDLAKDWDVPKVWDREISDYVCKSVGVKTIVIPTLNESIINTDLFKASFGHGFSNPRVEEAITRGLSIGTRLGRKLQVRNDERSTINNRQRKGRLDKRMIASLGFDNESVFNTKFVEKYSDAFIHLSIDASGSMSGAPFQNCVQTATAIAKAATVIKNMTVVISFRSTRDGQNVPVVLIGYDSRKDKISKISKLFSRIRPIGLTPEGLCFEAIQDHILGSNDNRKSYFINLSDGEPNCWSKGGFTYGGNWAAKHTQREIAKMRDRGVKIMSYFVSGYSYGVPELFKIMYGKDVESINVEQINELSKTLNKLLVKK